MNEIWFIASLFLAVATIYSSVGFGGGSSYIAILLALDYTVSDARITALVCNIIVVSSASIAYHNAGYIHWKKIWPLLIFSIPLAYIGGTLHADNQWYKIIASITLILISMIMITKHKIEVNKLKNISTGSLSGIGGGIGLLSGFIGIGGGIFLSPILHISKWQSAKIISATASIFILVNSVAGILGQLSYSPVINIKQLLILGCSVLGGGVIGSQLNIKILKADKIKLLTGILVGIVGVRLLIMQF